MRITVIALGIFMFLSAPLFAEQILIGPDLDGMIDIKEGSSFTVLSKSPQKISLQQGELMMVQEGQGAPPIQILTPSGLVELGSGGAMIQAGSSGTSVRVFGDRVKFGNKTVTEGFAYTQPAKKGKSALTRLEFRDYEKWTVWIRKWYEKKDDFIYERVEKEMDW